MRSMTVRLVLLIISVVAVFPTLTIQMMVESRLSNLSIDNTFLEDTLCTSIFNDHPCVKNILTVLVNHITDNMRKIESNKEKIFETIEILRNQLRKNQEVQDTNQLEIKLLKAQLTRMKMILYSDVNSKERNVNIDQEESLLHTTNRNKEKLTWYDSDKKRNSIVNSTQVSQKYKLF